jgi:hypothetical protein
VSWVGVEWSCGLKFGESFRLGWVKLLWLSFVSCSVSVLALVLLVVRLPSNCQGGYGLGFGWERQDTGYIQILLFPGLILST